MRLRTLILAVALAAPIATRATPDFPGAMQRDLQLSAPPACTSCHATDAGGAGTVSRPFGKYLVSRGLVPFDESSLAGALAAAAGERHDTDGDGISDVDALKQGLDPNGSPAHTPTLEDPSFGCSATGASGGTSTLLLILVVALRILAARMCRRRGLECSDAPDPSAPSDGPRAPGPAARSAPPA